MTDNRVHERAFETSVQTEAMIERLEQSLDRMRTELDKSHRLLVEIATTFALGVRTPVTRTVKKNEKPSPLPKATARMRKP